MGSKLRSWKRVASFVEGVRCRVLGKSCNGFLDGSHRSGNLAVLGDTSASSTLKKKCSLTSRGEIFDISDIVQWLCRASRRS
jgi:hypothetical protein